MIIIFSVSCVNAQEKFTVDQAVDAALDANIDIKISISFGASIQGYS